jgi:hypothetical protein
LLDERVDPEAAYACGGDGEVALFGAFKVCHLLVAHHGAGQGERVVGCQWLWRHFGHLAIHLDSGWKFCGDEQVAAVATHHQLEQVIDKFTGLIAFHQNFSRGCSSVRRSFM